MKKILIFILLALGLSAYSQYTEDFAYTDFTKLQNTTNWNAQNGELEVRSGKITPNTGSGGYVAAYYVASVSDDQGAEITLNALSSGDYHLGIMLRGNGNSGSPTYYYFYANSVGSEVGKVVAGVKTSLATGGAYSTNDVIRFEAVGTELRCYKNGALNTSIDSDGKITDASISSGYIGVAGNGSNDGVTADDWSGGAVAPPPAPGDIEAYWRMENNGTDDVANHDLVAKNSAGFTNAYLFEGFYVANLNVGPDNRFITQDKIDLSSGAVTINFAVRQGNLTGNRAIISNQPTYTSKGFRIMYDEINQRIEVLCHNGSTSGSAYSADGSCTQNTFIWVTVRFMDINGQYVRIFINGSQSGTDTTALSGTAINDTVCIGDTRDGQETLFGRVDNVSIYKCALPAANITDLYNHRTSNYTVSCNAGCPAFDGGTIASNQTVSSGGDVAAFTNSASASGGTGSIAYHWEYSTSSSTAGSGSWTVLIDSTRNILDWGTVSQTTYFTRYGSASTCGSGYSNVLAITVNAVATPTADGYDSTYVLACKQKYAIGEDVQNGDYVGTWLKNRTWKTSGTISYQIANDPLTNAFSINSSTGLITIQTASKINGKIVAQDTIINLMIRTIDSNLGYEDDTAEVRVKENAYCTYVDYGASNGSGTRASPKNDLDNVTWTAGRMVLLKRGVVIMNETTSLNTLISTASHPLLVGAYGTGNKPKFSTTSPTSICWYLTPDPTNAATENNTRIEYMYFYEIIVRNYESYAWHTRRVTHHMGWYNCETYNCDKGDVQSSFVISTSDYADSVNNWPFEFINYVADTTSSFCPDCPGSAIEPSHMKCGVGPLYLTNCYFGKSMGLMVRLAGGVASYIPGSVIKHCVFEQQVTPVVGLNGYSYNMQIRQDNCFIEDCTFDGKEIGIYLGNYAGTTELQPDNFHVKNCKFKNMSYRVIWFANQGSGYKAFRRPIIENCDIQGTEGIRMSNVELPKIRYNKIHNITGSAIVTVSPISQIQIHYNSFWSLSSAIPLSVGSGTQVYNNFIDGSINFTGSTTPLFSNNFYRSVTGLTPNAFNIDLDGIVTSDYFVDYANKNFNLKSTAILAIDLGTNLGLTKDINGTSVPQALIPDIGSHEYIYPLPPPPVIVPSMRRRLYLFYQ